MSNGTMAACKAPDQCNRASLPFGFEDLLNDIVRSVINSQPLDLVDHIADYLEALVDRRTLWDMQLDHGKQRHSNQNRKSSIIKSETYKTETHADIPPCAAVQKPTCAQNLQHSPSPKPQTDPSEDSTPTEAKAKPRPVSTSRKPIRCVKSPAKQDAWADEVVLASHLAQHEALRQVIKEIGDTNEQIIALEETVGNATQGNRRNTRSRDLAEKHSSLKSALDKMILICSWIKSNELGESRSPEVHENMIRKTNQRKQQISDDVNQGVLENQIETLKNTIDQIQAAFADKRRKETSHLAQDTLILNSQKSNQISSETRGHRDNANTNIMDDIAKLNQWLQYMFATRSEAQETAAAMQDSISTNIRNDPVKSTPRPTTKRQQQTVTTLVETQTPSTQNIVMMTNTAPAKKALLKKPKTPNVEADTSSASLQSSANSFVPDNQTKASAAKQTPHSRTNVPEMEKSIQLQYYVSETDKKKDTRVMLVSTTSPETTTARKTAQINVKSVSVAESKTSSASGMKQAAATDTSNSIVDPRDGPKKPQFKVKPAATSDLRRNSEPQQQSKKSSKTVSAHLNSSGSLTRVQHTGTETPKSQATTNESNVANIGSYSAVPDTLYIDDAGHMRLSHESMTSSYINVFCKRSTSSVSANSRTQNQTPSQTNAANLFKTLSNVSSLLQTHAASNQPTDERILSHEIFSASFIKSQSFATAQVSVQNDDTTAKKENSEKLSQNADVPKTSSHSTARSGSQKANTTKPATDNLAPNSNSAASFLKTSSHSATTKSSPKKEDEPKKENVTTSDYLPRNDYSSASFGKMPSDASRSPHKVDTVNPATATTPESHQAYVYSNASFVKASVHSTDKADPKGGDAGSPNPQMQATAKGDPKRRDTESSIKEVVVAVTTPKATSNILIDISSNSAAKLVNQKGDVSTPTKDIVLNKEIGSPAASFAKSTGQSPIISSSHKAEIAKPPSSHSVTKSGTQNVITSSVEPSNDKQPMNDQTQSPRFVEYKNIFPQLSEKPITTDTSSTSLSKKNPLTASGKSLSKSSQKNLDSGGAVSSIERIKPQVPSTPQQKETGLKTEITNRGISQTEDPIENAFSKISKDSAMLEKASAHIATKSMEGTKEAQPITSNNSTKLDKASAHSVSKSMGSTKEADATTSNNSAKLDKASVHSATKSMEGTKEAQPITSNNSAKLDKASVHSASKSMGSTKEAEATTSNNSTKLDKASVHSASKSMDSGKQVQRDQTGVHESQLTAESNNNNIGTKQDNKESGKIPIKQRNPSEVSLFNFKMPEDPIKETDESEMNN